MKIIFYFIAFIVLASLPSCEEAEDISGDSSMKIINECKYSVKVYFDDTYIGRVDADDSETWSVPSGQHTIKAKCSFAQDYEHSFNFTPGNTTTVRLELTNKFKSGEVVISNSPGQ